MDDMAIWFDEPNRRPLLIKGAYGVGKTWSVKDFSMAFFDDIFIVDLDKDEDFQFLLEGEVTDREIWALLSERFSGKSLFKGLLVFDEIQYCDGAVEKLCRFAANNPTLTICMLQSSMGVTVFEINNQDRICTLYLKPMSFLEYLIANKENALSDYIENIKTQEIDDSIRARLFKYLREYLVIGGMPGVVQDFIKNKSYEEAERIKSDILTHFEKDIKRAYGKTVGTRARRIVKSIPHQLDRTNKKFMFKLVEENARKREYSPSVDYLNLSGELIRIENIKGAELPLYRQVDSSSYELFMVDVGLLFTVARMERPVAEDDKDAVKQLFDSLKGGFGEQFVVSELYGSRQTGILYYWNSEATARVPLVFEAGDQIMPIDIRFTNSKKVQSVKLFMERFGLDEFIRVNSDDISYEENCINIPLYGLSDF